MSTSPAHIRSFHPRRSRMTPTAASALNRLLPVLGVTVESAPSDLGSLFDPALPVILEIGSGMGDATLEMARRDDLRGIVAVDVHTPGIGALLAGVERGELRNVRVCVGDAVELVARLKPASLDGIRIWFPDPWPKARHRKRRLIQSPFIRRAAAALAPGATLHLATDIADYAEQMLACCESEPMLSCGEGLIDPPEWRPTTRFEQRALAAGRRTWDLIGSRVE